MKKILILTILSLGVCAIAQVTETPETENSGKVVKIGDKMVPIEKVRESVHKASLIKTGGRVRRPNSARGWFVLADATKTVSETTIKSALAIIDKRAKIQTKVVQLATYNGNPKETIVKDGGKIGIVLVSDETTPSLLLAPEDGWAVVNIAKLNNGTTDETVIQSRIRKEILRAFAFISGGAYAARGDFLMRDVKRPQDLDSMEPEDYGIELLRRFEEGLPFYGITPWHETTYLKACEEGWAAKPENEYQQAIWNKVHSLPTEPLKIAPESTKQN